MIRGTWVWDRAKQELVSKGDYYRDHPRLERSDFPLPMLSRGQLDDVWNPDDGKHYSTLRNYEKAIRKGKHIVEKGEAMANPENHKARKITIDEKDVKQSIAEAWDQLESSNNE